jgi:hypothetical protein
MDYLTNYYKNLSEQIQEKIFKLEKTLNEVVRPTFIPLTVAYDDSGDRPPQVATLTDAEEEELLKVDNYGGRYPNKEYAHHDRAWRAYEMGISDINTSLFLNKHRAKQDLLAQNTYRGRPLSSMPGSKTAQNLIANFERSYQDSPDLVAQKAGKEILKNLSMRILDNSPGDKEFLNAERERIDRIAGRRQTKNNWPFGTYTGD